MCLLSVNKDGLFIVKDVSSHIGISTWSRCAENDFFLFNMTIESRANSKIIIDGHV